MTVAPRAPSQVRPDATISKALDRAVLTALHRDALKRFGSTDEFRAALEQTQSLSRPALSVRGRSFALFGAALPLVASGLFALAKFSRTDAPSSGEAPVQNPVIDIDALEDVASPVDPEGLHEGPEKAAPVRVVDAAHASSVPASSVPPEALERVRRLLKAGRSIAAHHAMKELAEGRLDNPEVLALLTFTARKVKAWGEALAVAHLRARVAPSADAYYELARLERATLKGDPLASLRRALELDPDHVRAQELLSDYEKQEKLAHR